MIPARRLYAIAGGSMLVLIVSMLLDALIPTVQSVVLAALAHPIVAYVGVVALIILAFDRSTRLGTDMLFILALITLFTVLLNEGLVSIVGTGALSVEIAALAALGLHIRWAFLVIALSGLAAVLSGTLLFSSLVVSVLIGAGFAALLGGDDDA